MSERNDNASKSPAYQGELVLKFQAPALPPGI